MEQPRKDFIPPTPANGPRTSIDGVWTLDGHKLYCNIAQLLKVADLEDTDDNRELTVKIAVGLAAHFDATTQIIII